MKGRKDLIEKKANSVRLYPSRSRLVIKPEVVDERVEKEVLNVDCSIPFTALSVKHHK